MNDPRVEADALEADALEAVLAWMRLHGALLWWCHCGDLTTTGEQCDNCRAINEMHV